MIKPSLKFLFLSEALRPRTIPFERRNFFEHRDHWLIKKGSKKKRTIALKSKNLKYDINHIEGHRWVNNALMWSDTETRL